MRKLQPSDLFTALRLIKKANLKEEIKPILKLASSGELKVEDVGIEGILSVIEIISEKKSEQAFFDILSGPFEMDAKQVAALDLNEFADKIEQLVRENDLNRFFILLAGLNSKK